MSVYTPGLAVRIYKPPHWWKSVHYELLEPLELLGFTVPVGFYCDAATTPRWAWALFPPMGRYADAAFLHDYLLVKTELPRREADLFFWKALLQLGVAQWRAFVMYNAVRLNSRWVEFKGRWIANG